MRRRDVLNGAAGATLATALGPNLEAQAAQAAVVRPADFVFKNGKIITVDSAFTRRPHRRGWS